MVVNALARLEYTDEALFLHLRKAVLRYDTALRRIHAKGLR